jgi:hypothetical protein
MDGVTMAWVYRGLYLIGDKKTGRITNVQVENNIRGRQDSLPFAVYLEPNHQTLPWQEVIKKRQVRHKFTHAEPFGVSRRRPGICCSSHSRFRATSAAKSG